MAKSKNTHQPVLYITKKAVADLPANRFVSYFGGVPSNETKALGVTDIKFLLGESASIQVLGTAIIETATALTIGDPVTTDATGKAKLATGAMPINGRVVVGTTGAGFATILLVC